MLEALFEALRKAGQFNSNAEIAPVAILWTDEDRHWEHLVASRLRSKLPLLTFGAFDPGLQTGPAIWLRCALAGVLPDLKPFDSGDIPILYLPGVGRAMLRAVEDCPKDLQPLAELQYRGAFFSHPNGKDWTPAAFLQAALGVGVTDGRATREALGRALIQLADEPLEELRKQMPLKAAYLNVLLSPDPDRQVLAWLNDPKGERSRLEMTDPTTWEAFRAHAQAEYGFDPVKDGELTAAAELGGRGGRWLTLWNRFADAPQNYPNLYDLLRRARPSEVSFFDDGVWPQDTETAEAALHDALIGLEKMTATEAREAIVTLEGEHGSRRTSVWAKIGKAPLAMALEHLAVLAQATTTNLGAGSPRALAQQYTTGAWRIDWAALQALACKGSTNELTAIKTAVRSMYFQWLETAAIAFQEAIKLSGYEPVTGVQVGPGGCLLFSDGLRFDVAQQLNALLAAKGLNTNLSWRFTAMPSVTDTAKPAVSPIAAKLEGGQDFKATFEGAKVTVDVLRRALEKDGYTILRDAEIGVAGSTRAWTECGNLDHLGHTQETRMAARIEDELRTIVERIESLLAAGWTQVKVVTDHGWLLMPNDLPKVNLAEHLTEVRKGRAARVKPNASTDQQTVPWFYSSDVPIAVAPGIACYVDGKEYEHGGLSLQECVVPVLTVTLGSSKTLSLTLSSRWKGLRCEIKIAPVTTGLMADIRTKAGDANTSLAHPKPIGDQGSVSLVVANDSFEGQAAIIVVIDPEGQIVAQIPTVIGGDL